MYIKILVLTFILNIRLLHALNTNKFVDAAELEILVFEESEIIKEFEDFFIINQQKLDTLKLKIGELKSENEKGLINSDGKFFSNPINIFSTIRRLTVDWNEILNDNFLNVKKNLSKNISAFPKIVDLQSSVNAIFWLQDIYNLSTSDLVRGEINGINYNTSLCFKDCIELGYTAFENEDYYHTILWLNETLSLIDTNNIERNTIFKVLSTSYFRIGDINNARKYYNKVEILSHDEWNDQWDEEWNNEWEENWDEQWYDQLDKEGYPSCKIYQNLSVTENDSIINKFPDELYENLLETKLLNYPELCRNGNLQNSKRADLSCFYENYDIPFLLIAPFKTELINIDPLVVIFHDVIYDEEIKSCQDRMKHGFEYAKTTSSCINSSETNDRWNKVTWINEDIKSINNILQRASDMTNLNPNFEEPLNINYYEVGGYFLPHCDSYNIKNEYAYGRNLNDARNRIATIIYYLNDVEQGGATVFTKINISVQPKKGSALFWYNLHSSGDVDLRTTHGGCPVLIGSKWIGTVWIYV